MPITDLLELPDLTQAISCADASCLRIQNPSTGEIKLGFYDLGQPGPLQKWNLLARLPASTPG